MVERGDHGRVRQDPLGLLGGRAVGDREGVRALLVEAERVDAVDDDLAGELSGQRRQQVGVTLVRHGDDDQVRRGRLVVAAAGDAVDADGLGGLGRAFGRATAERRSGGRPMPAGGRVPRP